jgi:hypothetical protein
MPTVIYSKSFSGSLDSYGSQKAMPLPALTAGVTYQFNVGLDVSWQSRFTNHLPFYITYVTQPNYSGSYAGQPKNASGTFSFPSSNQRFVTASLVKDDYKFSVYGSFDDDNNQNPTIEFTPSLTTVISESFLRVVGDFDSVVTVASLP